MYTFRTINHIYLILLPCLCHCFQGFQRRWGEQMVYKVPYERKIEKSSYGFDDLKKPVLKPEEDRKPWQENVIPSQKPIKKPFVPSLKPGRPQIIDLGLQFRPRPTRPPLNLFSFLISRDDLEKRRKVLMEWSLTAQIKV